MILVLKQGTSTDKVNEICSWLQKQFGVQTSAIFGSGTTIIAAEITRRACHAIELNPAYVDVAVKRWQDFTGGSAVLDGSGGKTFAEIAGERALKAA